MRAPGFGEGAGGLLVGAGLQPEQFGQPRLHRQVARRPDVGAAFGEQQVDFCRPAADALDPGEFGDGFLVVGGQRVELEFAREIGRATSELQSPC